ncbi:MAG: carboxypeptidase-like regulatory domain-containing protein, partial [Bacteroidales bacterium]|nr:carboxypeptidase-like regulatory domain-containing protein [Bacteroidales bacterium]
MNCNALRTLLLSVCVVCIGALSLSAQQSITVTGTVNDANGGTMPGVNVVIQGTTTGVVTDANGNYTITAPNAESVLVVSYIG